MVYATNDEINHLRQMLKNAFVDAIISPTEIDISDCQSLYRLLGVSAPEPRVLFNYATEIDKMPSEVYKKIAKAKLVDLN